MFSFYLVLAVVSTAIFTIKLILMFMGMDHDHSIDHHGDTDVDFKLISLQSVLAFMMGFGWSGLSVIVNYNTSGFNSLLISIPFGLFTGLLGVCLLWVSRQLEQINTRSVQTLVGTLGKAYTSIPCASGLGKVEVVLHGKSELMDATCSSEDIDAFEQVLITGVQGNKILEVTKIGLK